MAVYEVSESWILGVVVMCTGKTYDYVESACCWLLWRLDVFDTYWRVSAAHQHQAGPFEDSCLKLSTRSPRWMPVGQRWLSAERLVERLKHREEGHRA